MTAIKSTVIAVDVAAAAAADLCTHHLPTDDKWRRFKQVRRQHKLTNRRLVGRHDKSPLLPPRTCH